MAANHITTYIKYVVDVVKTVYIPCFRSAFVVGLLRSEHACIPKVENRTTER